MKKNCWEFKRCGKEPGGSHEHENGKCLVPLMSMYNGINDGHNGGRVCWLISGSLCGGEMQMAFSEKLKSCNTCDFYSTVTAEEGKNISMSLRALEDLLCRIKSE